MNAFTIKDLENLSGIKAHTIRIWEQRYSFIRPQRTETNIRYYTNDELKTILNVALLNKYGYKISHIDKMQPVEVSDKVMSLQSGSAQQEWIINQLLHLMVDMDVMGFESLLSEQITLQGIDKVIKQAIFPFLEKVGLLWQSNHINPAQEHLVSNIIRQKFLVGIDALDSIVTIPKTILLFLPENEFHELGLLYAYYILRKQGYKVLYLGASVPLRDLQYIVQVKKPDVLHTHLTASTRNINLDKYFYQLNNKVPNAPVLVTGPLIDGYEKRTADNIILKKAFTDVLEYIAGR